MLLRAMASIARSLGFGSALAPNWYDGAAMGPFANLLGLIVCLDLEAKLATIDLEELGANRNLLAFRCRAEVLDVDLEADGGVPLGQMRLYSLDARALHQPDHRRGGQHTLPSHVLDDKPVIDRRNDLCLEARCQASCQAVRRHGVSPVFYPCCDGVALAHASDKA